MSAIRDALNSKTAVGKTGFIPFITAGDPSPDFTLELLGLLAENGADVIELGIPFSDPVADGPVIQASAQRALEGSKMNVAQVLEIVRAFRKNYSTPIVLFGYLNPIHAYGFEEFARDAAKAGANGLLITDVVDGEFEKARQILSEHSLDLIPLIAPTTSKERIKSIVSNAAGFVYMISMRGVTGSKAVKGNEVEDLVSEIRMHTDLPVAVGFGISDAESFQRVGTYADAGVVGSAIVKRIGDAENEDVAKTNVHSFLNELLRQ